MTAERTPRAIDVGRLPKDVVALVEALGPGGNLVITRDGEAIARVTSTLGALITPARPEEAAEVSKRIGPGNLTVVVTAVKLSESARASLSDQLGPDDISSTSTPRR